MDLRHYFRQLKLRVQLPFFKQWIKSSTVPSFASFKPQHLNDFVMFSWDSCFKYPFNYSFSGRKLSTFSKLINTFTKSLIMQFGYPCFKWLISMYIKCLNIFCAPTSNGLVNNFMHRNGFSVHCKTATAQQDPERLIDKLILYICFQLDINNLLQV